MAIDFNGIGLAFVRTVSTVLMRLQIHVKFCNWFKGKLSVESIVFSFSYHYSVQMLCSGFCSKCIIIVTTNSVLDPR